MVGTVTFYSRLMMRLFLFTSTLIAANLASADVLFEGYSKVLLSGTHVGYAVQRYEFDPKKKEFSTVYYLKTGATGGNLTESLKARATASLKPISYQYTVLVGDKPKTIDATFKNDTMTAIVRENGKQESVQKKLPKGAFLASFLGYLMLQGKEGIKKGVKYGYQAIAEEDAVLYAGEAYISDEETVSGVNVFKILNTFKGSQFYSYVTHKGEAILTRSPVQQVETVLVATAAEATGGLSFNPGNLELLFGSVPKGTENVIARREGPQTPKAATTPLSTEPKPTKESRLKKAPAASGDSPKTEGVPPGQGIIIKPEPSAESKPGSGESAK